MHGEGWSVTLSMPADKRLPCRAAPQSQPLRQTFHCGLRVCRCLCLHGFQSWFACVVVPRRREAPPFPQVRDCWPSLHPQADCAWTECRWLWWLCCGHRQSSHDWLHAAWRSVACPPVHVCLFVCLFVACLFILSQFQCQCARFFGLFALWRLMFVL